MNLYLSIAFTLLAAIAGLYLLAKTRTENLGKFFVVCSWIIILVAGLSLLCQLGRGTLRMACRTGICPPSESCAPDLMHKEIIMRGAPGHMRMTEDDACCEKKACCGRMGSCYETEEMHSGCRTEESKGCMHDDGRHSGCAMEMKKDSARSK